MMSCRSRASGSGKFVAADVAVAVGVEPVEHRAAVGRLAGARTARHVPAGPLAAIGLGGLDFGLGDGAVAVGVELGEHRLDMRRDFSPV